MHSDRPIPLMACHARTIFASEPCAFLLPASGCLTRLGRGSREVPPRSFTGRDVNRRPPGVLLHLWNLPSWLPDRGHICTITESVEEAAMTSPALGPEASNNTIWVVSKSLTADVVPEADRRGKSFSHDPSIPTGGGFLVFISIHIILGAGAHWSWCVLGHVLIT